MTAKSERLVVGRFGAAHGVRGWVKVHSFTRPSTNLLHYRPWYTQTGEFFAEVELSRTHGQSLVVKLIDCDDRDTAQAYTHQEIFIDKAQLPATDTDEYYWCELEGLRVITVCGQDLGQVENLLETGANDVLLVSGTRTRAIPFLRERVIKRVDLAQGIIEVDWDPEF